jgi:cation transport protein ChaC
VTRSRAGDAGEAAPAPPVDGDLWVFGYGSLMWQPGFAYEEVCSALLRGYHRAFCIYSCHYRGTPEEPGLVLGLARGGSCRGLAFRVDAAAAAAVVAYLDERELAKYAYRGKLLPVAAGGRPISAYTFVADPDHPQYAGRLALEEIAGIVMRARGIAGLNRDYLIQTIRQLEREGFRDRHLHALLRRVEHLTGMIEAGGGI